MICSKGSTVYQVRPQIYSDIQYWLGKSMRIYAYNTHSILVKEYTCTRIVIVSYSNFTKLIWGKVRITGFNSSLTWCIIHPTMSSNDFQCNNKEFSPYFQRYLPLKRWAIIRRKNKPRFTYAYIPGSNFYAYQTRMLLDAFANLGHCIRVSFAYIRILLRNQYCNYA
jgi:hypothetical protein